MQKNGNFSFSCWVLSPYSKNINSNMCTYHEYLYYFHPKERKKNVKINNYYRSY